MRQHSRGKITIVSLENPPSRKVTPVNAGVFAYKIYCDVMLDMLICKVNSLLIIEEAMHSNNAEDRILFILKTKGSKTAQEIAHSLKMTSMGARQHLHTLESKSLVTSFSENQGVGRPKQYWQLSEHAQARFPNTHAFLTVDLIEAVGQAFGEQGIEKVVAQREQAMLATYQDELAQCHNLAAKLKSLAKIRSREGYMAEVKKEKDGSYLLIENHCPICAAANKCQLFCKSELQLFQQILADEKVEVTREKHIITGARRCVYRIKSKLKVQS